MAGRRPASFACVGLGTQESRKLAAQRSLRPATQNGLGLKIQDAAPAWYLIVLNPTEFVVLYPKITFQDLGGSGKAEQSHIASAESAAGILRHQPRAGTRRPDTH
jgi:hypothetical protein